MRLHTAALVTTVTLIACSSRAPDSSSAGTSTSGAAGAAGGIGGAAGGGGASAAGAPVAGTAGASAGAASGASGGAIAGTAGTAGVPGALSWSRALGEADLPGPAGVRHPRSLVARSADFVLATSFPAPTVGATTVSLSTVDPVNGVVTAGPTLVSSGKVVPNLVALTADALGLHGRFDGTLQVGATTLKNTSTNPFDWFFTTRLAATGAPSTWSFTSPAGFGTSSATSRSYAASALANGAFTVAGDFTGTLSFGGTLVAKPESGFVGTVDGLGKVAPGSFTLDATIHADVHGVVPAGGGHFLCGDVDGQIVLDKPMGLPDSPRHFFVGLRKSDGTWAWSIDVSSGPSGSAYAQRLAAAAGNSAIFALGYYKAGTPMKNGQPLFPASSGAIASLVLAVGADGVDLWKTRIAGGDEAYGTDLAVDGKGDVYVVGKCKGNVTVDQGVPGPVNLVCGMAGHFLVKLSGSSGKLVWARALSTNLAPGLSSDAVVAVLGDAVVMAGSYVGTLSVDGVDAKLPPGPAGYLLRFDP